MDLGLESGSVTLVRAKGNNVPIPLQKASWGLLGSYHWASSSSLPLSPIQRRVFNNLSIPVTYTHSALPHLCTCLGPI